MSRSKWVDVPDNYYEGPIFLISELENWGLNSPF